MKSTRNVTYRLYIDRRRWRLSPGMEIRQRLAKNLRRLRQEKGWSQEAFADAAGLHRTYISDLERAARNPTITVVEKLAVPLDVTAGRLLE